MWANFATLSNNQRTHSAEIRQTIPAASALRSSSSCFLTSSAICSAVRFSATLAPISTKWNTTKGAHLSPPNSSTAAAAFFLVSSRFSFVIVLDSFIIGGSFEPCPKGCAFTFWRVFDKLRRSARFCLFRGLRQGVPHTPQG